MPLPGSMSTSFAMCLICRESVADLKRYNVKRHCDSKHKKCFDGASVGKDERMKEFKKRFDATTWARRESICVYRHFKPS